jgi:DegV family protein with EDD domain
MRASNLEKPEEGEKSRMRILTDSAADLQAGEKANLEIEVAPLVIQFPDGEVSAEEISPDDFYDRLRAMVPKIPTTSQPSSGAFADMYRRIGELGEEILSIHISSGLSGTLESAQVGARQVSGLRITHVDSLTLSGGQRYQVLAAALGSRAGWSREGILEHLNLVREGTEVIYTLETLEYLARGGRIGRVQALAGSLLKLKPIIKVDKSDGKYSTAGKGRTLKRTMEAMVDHLVQTYGQSTELWISVMHGQLEDHAQTLVEMIHQNLKVAKCEILRISPVLGVHTGPGVVGAAAVPFELFRNLLDD